MAAVRGANRPSIFLTKLLLLLSDSRYGTMNAHIRRHASVPVVFVVYLRAHVQFCWFHKADATADVQ